MCVSSIIIVSAPTKPLLNSIRKRAATRNSTRKFSLQSVSAPNFETIYSLLQCTPNLSEMDCNTCLQQVQDYIPLCCNGKQGGIFVATSCVIRYETYLFYNPSAETTSPPPELPTSTPGMHWCCFMTPFFFFFLLVFHNVDLIIFLVNLINLFVCSFSVELFLI